MRISIDEEKHIYSVNGDIASISVTELLHKHKLAPDYKGVDKAKLKESATKGKAVHKDLENILNEPKYEPTTEQGKNFKKWVDANLDCGVGEQMLGLDYKGLLIAGTADVMAIGRKGEYILADHKNTSKFQQEYVTWQVNILDYMARKLGKEEVNGKKLNWKGALKFYCFKYDPKTGEMTPYELEKIPDSEIEELLEKEYKGELYERKQLAIDNTLRDKFIQTEQFLYEKELEYKRAEADAKAIREELLKLFEEQGILSWETPSGLLKVTYIQPIDKVMVDSRKLKDKYPQIYNECQKITKQKASIRITNRNKGESYGEWNKN